MATARFTVTVDGADTDSWCTAAEDQDPAELARWLMGRITRASAIRLWWNRDMVTPTWGLGEPDAEVTR